MDERPGDSAPSAPSAPSPHLEAAHAWASAPAKPLFPWRSILRRIIPVNARARLHFELIRRQWLSELFARLDPAMRGTEVKDETHLVMDGFPRSANSWARMAYHVANGEDEQISSHRHSPRSIEAAVQHGVPAIVLIRPPRQAIGSLLQYEPGISPKLVAAQYQFFYETILPIADDVVIAPFAEVTKDFGSVLRRVNTVYGTDFVPYVPGPENDAAVNAMLDQATRLRYGSQDVTQRVGRAQAARRPADEILAELGPRFERKLKKLDRLYDDVMAHHQRRLTSLSDGEAARK
jgi:hypothetical protein